MAKNPKQSTIDALNRHCEKQLEKDKPKRLKTHNAKPEKAVEKACLELMRSWGWSVNIFESKATWNPKAGAWLQQGMKAGTCDCMGSTDDGVAVAIEFKSPGRLSTFNSEKRYLQRQFIVDKINANNFACVVDSSDRLALIYSRWKMLRLESQNSARSYLISMLPAKSAVKALDEETLFGVDD